MYMESKKDIWLAIFKMCLAKGRITSESPSSIAFSNLTQSLCKRMGWPIALSLCADDCEEILSDAFEFSTDAKYRNTRVVSFHGRPIIGCTKKSFITLGLVGNNLPQKTGHAKRALVRRIERLVNRIYKDGPNVNRFKEKIPTDGKPFVVSAIGSSYAPPVTARLLDDGDLLRVSGDYTLKKIEFENAFWHYI